MASVGANAARIHGSSPHPVCAAAVTSPNSFGPHREYSVAMTSATANVMTNHLLRRDQQEDVCFATWFPSAGESRSTALIERMLPPLPGDRNIHGNASFNAGYLERALSEASAAGGGLALLHSHPGSKDWQDLSADDSGDASGTDQSDVHPGELSLGRITPGGDRPRQPVAVRQGRCQPRVKRLKHWIADHSDTSAVGPRDALVRAGPEPRAPMSIA